VSEILDPVDKIVRVPAALRRFTRQSLAPGEAARDMRQRMARREASSMRMIERSVSGHPESRCLALLRVADGGPGDVQALVSPEGTAPDYLVTPETSSRAAALLPVEELLKIQEQAPGPFDSLVDMGRALPAVPHDGLHVRSGWAGQNSGVVRGSLRAFLTANRQVDVQPQLPQVQAVNRPSLEPETAQSVAVLHLSQRLWDPTGGLTPAYARSALDSLTELGALPPGMQVGDVTDLSFLNAVLDEIGRCQEL